MRQCELALVNGPPHLARNIGQRLAFETIWPGHHIFSPETSMDEIGDTHTPATNDAAIPRERIDPAPARPRTTIIGAVLGSVVALLFIAAAIYYLAGRDAGH